MSKLAASLACAAALLAATPVLAQQSDRMTPPAPAMMDKPMPDKAMSDKAMTDKAMSDKAMTDKTMSDKAMTDGKTMNDMKK